MKCEYCDNPVPNDVTRCPSCGAAISIVRTQLEPVAHIQGLQYSHSDQRGYMEESMVTSKNKWIYILLGVFLGVFGVHNFYTGYIGRGITKLLITVLSFGGLFWVSWIWALIEIILVRIDSRGVPFSS